MNIVLFDPPHRHWLFPFTQTRPVAELRSGIMTLRMSWEHMAGAPAATLTVPELEAAPDAQIDAAGTLYINAALMPDVEVWKHLRSLRLSEGFVLDDTLLALRSPDAFSLETLWDLSKMGVHGERLRTFPGSARVLRYPWELVQWNAQDLESDFMLLTAGRKSASLDDSNRVMGKGQVFIEEGAKVNFSVLNTEGGPVYIGRDAVVMEGCLIRGPFALGDHAVLKMGAKVYGATTLGPRCVGGGELKNVILMGYSNKAHDGYLGDALIGEWCNLGAGTTNSNIKNTATQVRVWNPGKGEAVPAGMKAGLFMGDYSRSAIQAAFNTGTVVGTCCNVFGGGTCSGYLPDFSWGMAGERYGWEKAVRDISNWKKLKGESMSEREIRILRTIFAAI